MDNPDSNYSGLYSEHTSDRVEKTSLVIYSNSPASVDTYSDFYSSGDFPVVNLYSGYPGWTLDCGPSEP